MNDRFHADALQTQCSVSQGRSQAGSQNLDAHFQVVPERRNRSFLLQMSLSLSAHKCARITPKAKR